MNLGGWALLVIIVFVVAILIGVFLGPMLLSKGKGEVRPQRSGRTGISFKSYIVLLCASLPYMFIWGYGLTTSTDVFFIPPKAIGIFIMSAAATTGTERTLYLVITISVLCNFVLLIYGLEAIMLSLLGDIRLHSAHKKIVVIVLITQITLLAASVTFDVWSSKPSLYG